MFNLGNIFKGFSIAAQVAGLLSAAGNPGNVGDAVLLASQIALVVAPKLAIDPNFSTVQKVLQSIANAEQTGQIGQVGSADFLSHGTKLRLVVSVEKI